MPVVVQIRRVIVFRDQEIDVPEVNPRIARRAGSGENSIPPTLKIPLAVSFREAPALFEQSGAAEARRPVSVARHSAMNIKAQAINQLRALLVSAPQEIYERLWKKTGGARWRLRALSFVGPYSTAANATSTLRF